MISESYDVFIGFGVGQRYFNIRSDAYSLDMTDTRILSYYHFTLRDAGVIIVTGTPYPSEVPEYEFFTVHWVSCCSILFFL